MLLKKTCELCGLRYHHNNICYAKNATCNKCRRIGHFGRVCRSAKRSNERKDVNPALKNQRDRLRMTEFLRRKDAMNLPFFGVDDSVMTTLRFNSAVRGCGCPKVAKTNLRELDQMKSIIERQTLYIDSIRRERDTLQTQLGEQATSMDFQRRERDTLKTQLGELSTKLERAEDKHRYLESELSDAEVRIDFADTALNKMSAELSKKTQMINTLKEQNRHSEESRRSNSELQTRVSALSESVKNDKAYITQLREENTTLTEKMSKLQALCDLHENNSNVLQKNCMQRHARLDAIKTETSEMSTRTGGRQHGRNSCRNCGSRDRVHLQKHCPASRHRCRLCNETGHFTIFCAW